MNAVVVVRCSLRAALAFVLVLLVCRPTQAERQHTVREGQSLISIARGYDVSVSSLAAANERGADTPLRVGEVLSVPEKGVVVLGAGQSLWSVARRYDCTVDELARVNGLTTQSSLRPGLRLRLPGARGKTKAGVSASVVRAGRSSASQVSTDRNPERGPRAGMVSLLRIATNERLKLTVTDASGKVRPAAVARMARFLRPRSSTKQKRPDPRLLALLTQVSSHFGGKTIQVMSGYRVAGGYTNKESRHTKGAAMDIRIEGVQNRALCDYLRHFKNVGVGFYPHSSFVHFDVREKNAYWIDMSSPGRRPSYLDREQRDHFDGKNKDDGLVDLARSVQAALEQSEHGEPSADAPQASDE